MKELATGFGMALTVLGFAFCAGGVLGAFIAGTVTVLKLFSVL